MTTCVSVNDRLTQFFTKCKYIYCIYIFIYLALATMFRPLSGLKATMFRPLSGLKATMFQPLSGLKATMFRPLSGLKHCSQSQIYIYILIVGQQLC
jgi:hypothetical protein